MKIMIINGKKYRKLPKGRLVRKTDVFVDGHEVESYNVGKPNTDDKYYTVYREIKVRQN